jgi:hypothetical protein
VEQRAKCRTWSNSSSGRSDKYQRRSNPKLMRNSKGLTAEQSAVNLRARRKASGAIREPDKASSVGHRVICGGAELRTGHGAIHARTTGAKRQSTEQSVDRRGGPGGERGAIRERRKAGSGGRGAIQARRGMPAIVGGAIRRRGKSSKC